MREEEINGFKVTVVSDEDAEQLQQETGGHVIWVCLRPEDEIVPPYPALAARRRIGHCTDCGHRIWQDPLSVPKGITNPTPKCVQCALGKTTEELFGSAPGATTEELFGPTAFVAAALLDADDDKAGN